MANSKTMIKNVASLMELKIGKGGTYCYGFYNGYPFLLEERKGNKSISLIATICASYMGQPIDYELFRGTALSGGIRMLASGYKINLVQEIDAKTADECNDLMGAIGMVVSKLRENGYTGSDEMGGVYNINLYTLNGSFCFYSIDNASHLEERFAQIRAEHEAKKEKYFLGLLGALGGALIGAGLIMLIGFLGHISFWTPVVMSVLCILFYDKLAGKFTVVSAVITGVISLAFSLIIPTLSAAVYLYQVVVENDLQYYYNFKDCFVHCREFYSAMDATFYYYRDVVLLSAIGIVTAAVLIIKGLIDEKNRNRIKQLG